MARTKEEISAEIDDAYDMGDYDHAKRLERDLSHMERVEGMAERMRKAGYADWEVAEEVEEATRSWQGVEDNTAALRRTGALIPTEPRILLDGAMGAAGAEPEQQRRAPSIDDDGCALPPMPAAKLLEGYRKQGPCGLPSDATACWAWLGEERRLCIEVSFMQRGSRGILRSSEELCLRAGWPDGAWSGDAIDSDGWHDLDPQDASRIAQERGLEGFRAYAVARAEEAQGHQGPERATLTQEGREARQAASALAQGAPAPQERAQAR